MKQSLQFNSLVNTESYLISSMLHRIDGVLCVMNTQIEDEGEIWSFIPEYITLYRASTLGRIMSYSRYEYGKLLKTSTNVWGYYMVTFSVKGKRKTFSVHRLIALAFLPNPLKLPCINHKNGIKTDNRLCNLEWCTYSENNVDALQQGLRVMPKGKYHWNNKFSEETITNIKQRVLNGEKRSMLAKEYKAHIQTIHRFMKVKS